MSDILNKIRSAFLGERKARNKINSDFLGTIIGAIESEAELGPDGFKTVSETVTISVLKNFYKNNTETLRILNDKGITDDKTNTERVWLEYFIPKQMTEQDILNVLNISGTVKNMKEAMSFLKTNHDGYYDGKEASIVVKKWISE